MSFVHFLAKDGKEYPQESLVKVELYNVSDNPKYERFIPCFFFKTKSVLGLETCSIVPQEDIVEIVFSNGDVFVKKE